MGLVLIVDDHDDIRTVLARLVRLAGYRIASAASGEEAIELATQERPGLVITDLMMPGMNGFDVLRSLRADPRTSTVPIVIFSALHDNELIDQAIGLGANDYWVKGSFDVAGLDRWLAYYLAEGRS